MMVINHLQYTREYYVLILFHGVSEISPEKDLLYFTFPEVQVQHISFQVSM